MRQHFPMSSLVGQEDLKLALLLVAIDPSIGGVLISGERGTGKSTAARGLATLLPPDHGRTPPFVELPLGATEDRVVGSLDVARALSDGRSELQSGLLAQADGGVLYVDEVNLLPDHLVNLLLDSAASGAVRVEREGLSRAQQASFVLVGSMNPEEGDLRPQFLDRFGLCVKVRGLSDRTERISAVRRRMAFDDSPRAFLEAAGAEQESMRARILSARDRLRDVQFADGDLLLLAEFASQYEAKGIRGDLAGMKSARALAAWQGVDRVTQSHLRRVAEMAFRHRGPRRSRSAHAADRVSKPSAVPSPCKEPGVGAPGAAGTNDGPSTTQLERTHSDELAADCPPRIEVITERSSPELRRDDGGRVHERPGRARGSAPFQGTGPLAVRDTLAMAALRGADADSQHVKLQPRDLRQREHERSDIWQVLFLVDVSGSVGGSRMRAARSVARGLLASNYQRRDEVALMVFAGECAQMVIPFTRDSHLVEEAVCGVATGGRTPLAAALYEAAKILRGRQPGLLVLFTDGRANVSMSEGDPWEEALQACEQVARACAGAVVVDCESGPVLLGRAQRLADVLGGSCISLESSDVTQVAVQVQRRLPRQ